MELHVPKTLAVNYYYIPGSNTTGFAINSGKLGYMYSHMT